MSITFRNPRAVAFLVAAIVTFSITLVASGSRPALKSARPGGGTNLVAGPGKQLPRGTVPTFAEFSSPNRTVACQMEDAVGSNRDVFCTSEKRALSVTLIPSGRLYICRAPNSCPGNPLVYGSHTLGYGKHRTVGRFRCRSQRVGVTCIVIRSGKGFLINGRRVARVGH
jgi:hypothetical protein